MAGNAARLDGIENKCGAGPVFTTTGRLPRAPAQACAPKMRFLFEERCKSYGIPSLVSQRRSIEDEDMTLRRVLGRWTKRVQYEAFELARRVATARFLSRVLQKMLRLKALTAFTTWTTNVQRRLTSHRSLLSRARALRRCAVLVKGGRLSLYFRAGP